MKNLFIIFATLAILTFTFSACKEKEEAVVVPLTNLRLVQNEFLMYIGDSTNLSLVFTPVNVTNKSVIWTNRDAQVVTLFEVPGTSGMQARIIAQALGEAFVTVTAQDGGITDSCYVAVTMPTIAGSHCNDELPGWGVRLGTVSFVSNREWAIGDQIWSDAVTATNCNKETYDGGYGGSVWDIYQFRADCRSNPDYPGDLFSWCAVARFEEQLCPEPWRAPTAEDFFELDIALGGSGSSWWNDNGQYFDVWGAVCGGLCGGDGGLVRLGTRGHYWALMPSDWNRCFWLRIDLSGEGFWEDNSGQYYKQYGHTLRCVR